MIINEIMHKEKSEMENARKSYEEVSLTVITGAEIGTQDIIDMSDEDALPWGRSSADEKSYNLQGK